MMLTKSEIDKIRRATGMAMTAHQVEAIIDLQDAEQKEQFARDLATAIVVYDGQLSGEATAAEITMLDDANKRLAWWWVMEGFVNATFRWRWLTNRFLRRLILGPESNRVPGTLRQLIDRRRS